MSVQGVGGALVGGPVLPNGASIAVGGAHTHGQNMLRTSMEMLAMRMRWAGLSSYPVDHISVYWSQKHPKAFVFLVHNQEAMTLEDDATMFPSDQLIAKLRLIIG